MTQIALTGGLDLGVTLSESFTAAELQWPPASEPVSLIAR